MSNIISHPNKVQTLTANFLTVGGDIAPQTAPTISIWRIVGGVPSLLVNEVLMSLHQAGEYFYDFTMPSVLGTYKVRYKGLIDGLDVYGYDTIENFSLKLFLDQFEVTKTFTYNGDLSVNTVQLDFGNPVEHSSLITFSYNGDKTVNDMQITDL